MELFIVIMSLLATAVVLVAAFWFVSRRRDPQINEEAQELENEKTKERVSEP
ncbi:MAG TPA: hypothetical protein VKY36_02655 [Moheibacter sp.]|nr:hypothetical protein [Moheibacter sp.]